MRIRFEVCARVCAFFFLCWPLEYGRPRELHQSIYGKKHREKRCPVPGARCQVPTAACCPPSARYPRPEKAPASGPPPCSPAPSKRLPGRSRTGSAPHAAFFLHAARRSLHCPLACFLLSFARRSAGSRVRPKLASCRAPSRTLILHLRTFADLLMAAPRREMSDRPTVCQSLRATRPSSQPLPSGYCHPFALFLSIPWRAFRSSTVAPGVSMGKPASI